VGSQTGNVGSPSLDKDVRLSSGLPGIDVVGARDGSWSCLCFTCLYLAAKPSHVGVDLDGLACFLHRPTYEGTELSDRRCPILSRCSERWRLSGGFKTPGTGYLTWC
jgi:hypothetical protein